MLLSRSDGDEIFTVAGGDILCIRKNVAVSLAKSSGAEDSVEHSEGECNGPLCCCLSTSGDLFAICDTRKILRIYKSVKGVWNLSEQINLPRKVSCITFTLDNQCILLGEKSGYVCRFSIGANTCLSKCDEQDEVLGHLSLLSSIALSEDGRLIGSCDRDEKIRISRFAQPYVIESFCLGHTKPISDIVFLDDTHLISVAGDGSLRLWNSVEGIQLDSFDVGSQLQQLCGVGLNDSHKTFLASRLIRVGCVALLGIQSHDCILAVRISKDLHAFERANGAIVASGVVCPGSQRFIDCCVINHKASGSFEVVCFTEPISILISWIVTYSNDSSLIWSQTNELDVLPSEWKIKNVQFPRIKMLTDMGKSFIDADGVTAYERAKAEVHKRIKERHQRHQAKRKRLKHIEKDEHEKRASV